MAVEVSHVLALACSAAAVCVALWIAARGAPSQVRAQTDEALEVARTAHRTADDTRSSWIAAQEALETLLEQIERKRRSAAAAASRAGAANGADQPMTRDDLLSQLRRGAAGGS